MAKTTKSARGSVAAATVHDQKLSQGDGGELHQTASGKTAVLTTAQGGPVSDDQNSLKVGPRGPTLLEDFHFREKIFHFDHERIPERVVHARGYAAHGFFENYKSLSKYTRADLFQRAGEKTPAFVRLRLGGPNFTHIQINAPKCPFAHFQQDGHMAMHNPAGRANYQPNSFGEGPRESPQRGFTPFADIEEGAKRRLRAERFADHYSQARQFFISQTMGEQSHIAAAVTFELSKVKTPAIRERMISHLLNINETLANIVAGKLGLQKMPKPADAAVPTRQDLDPSPALSIVENGPARFEGRKLGILVSDGSDADLLKALKGTLDKAAASYEIIALKVAGVEASDGGWVEADQMIDGGPSVLYDAVALLPAADAIDDLMQESSARDFVSDAFAHCKYIGYAEAALPLFEKSGIAAEELDKGCIAIVGAKEAKSFVDKLGKLRVWEREPNVKLP